MNPRIPIARTLKIADALAVEIGRYLLDKWPEANVERVYSPKIDDEQFAEWISSQKTLGIYVVPMAKKSALETRSTDEISHRFGIIFAEKCLDPNEEGVPSNEWMDERVCLLDAAEQHFGDTRTTWPSGLGTDLRAVESEIVMMFDPTVHRENHAFYGIWVLSLAESVVMV